MLKKLLGIFSKVERADSLEAWLQSRTSEEKKKLEASLNKYSKELENIFDKIEGYLKKLEDAELKNKKIPRRALQIMEGNRQSYIRNVRNFMKRTDTQVDEDFTEHVKSDLEALGQSNAKSSKVLGEFFLDETSRISEALRQVLVISQNVEQEFAAMKPFLDIKAQLQKEQDESAKLQAINKDIEKEKSRLAKSIRQKEELELALNEIVQSNEYKEHKDLLGLKKKLAGELLESERKINEYFSPLRPGLKKYAHMSLDEKSVDAYYDNPVKALAADPEMKIMNIVRDMCSVLDKGLIGMKDKKLEKISAAAKKFSRAELVQMLDERNKIIEKKKKTEENIRHTHNRDYDETEYKLNHIKDKIKNIEADIKDKEKAASQTKPEDERKKAFKMVKELGIELEIT